MLPMRWGLTAALLLTAPSWAGEQREAVLDLLNAYEQPPSAEALHALGGGVDEELMSIADDAQVASSRRGRAVSALAHFPNAAVRSWLEQRLAKPGKSILRRKAAGALGAGFGAAAVAPLAAALGDDDVQLRLAVVSALGNTGSPASRTALARHLEAESAEVVREAIRKALSE